jgi:hypothetical protein
MKMLADDMVEMSWAECLCFAIFMATIAAVTALTDGLTGSTTVWLSI